jgi:hypothetical protein
MYRSSPSACVACGERVEPQEADLSERGLICWRCAARGDLVRLHDAMRARVPRWQQLLGRGSLAAFCVGSVGLVLALGASGSPLLALADAALAIFAVHRLLRRDGNVGRAFAFVQGIGLVLAALGGGGPVMVLAALGATVGLGTAKRAFPLHPGDAPRLLEASYE